MRAEVAAVSCPSCGAGLQALGGGRVVLQVCAHCGAAMDAVENYRLLKTFAHRQRPETPFQLGMQGQILGTGWTVIGILGWAEAHNGQSWNWTDHQLYSPTHGYAWLTLEDGHLILTRACREALAPAWLTSLAVEAAEHRPDLRARGRTYRYYETSDARISYAEGEFSSRVMVGDWVQSLCFLSSDEMLTLTQSGPAREVELSTWLPQGETWASFGLTPQEPIWRVHPLQPYRPWRDEVYLTRVGGAVAVASCLLGIVLLGQGEAIRPVVQPGTGPLVLEAELPITRAQGLAQLQVSTDLMNAWSGVEVEMTAPDGTPIFQMSRDLGYYEGYEDGEHWSEGDQTLSITFRPTVAGDYALAVNVSEGGTGDASDGSPIRSMRLAAWQGQASSFWMWLVFIAALPVAAAALIRQSLHDMARWRGSDWSDED